MIPLSPGYSYHQYSRRITCSYEEKKEEVIEAELREACGWRPGRCLQVPDSLREKLLLRMSEIGVLRTIVRWRSAFLSDRQARVCLNNTTGRSVRMNQGLPQGSVLSPSSPYSILMNLLNSFPMETSRHYLLTTFPS